ncbi:OmpA family protein [Flavobacterium sp. NRK F10]|uniref:OmpA family protein n=1 Tax=Flavobacterium sp. NRK F10 TaxID=2954931 RepID=UPI0020905A06|nr:OmpA family protein [Flavobacterium sp. NRK F10]MCO6174178.1 OmpA family protein [Flavobacterium sp. NRK F10]
MKRVLFHILLFESFLSMAQTNFQTELEKQYAKKNYMEVIQLYKKTIARGYRSAKMIQLLADSYYYNSFYEQAAEWYEKLLTNEPEGSLNEMVYFRYYQVLKTLKQYDKAKEYFSLYLKTSKKYNLKIVEQDTVKLLPFSVTLIENLPLNTATSEYGLIEDKNTMIFTSNRENKQHRNKHQWTKLPYLSLYSGSTEKQYKSAMVKGIEKLDYNVSSPVFSKDGRTVYFTVNDLTGKDHKNEKYGLKIVKATIDEKGNWEDIVFLPFNSNQYNCAHPALSTDEKILYFSSDMPGGYGQSDIYAVEINKGQFGTPINLGNIINTSGRETFPAIEDNSGLYFASDGRMTFGGLDIFKAKLWNGIEVLDVLCLPEPINSSWDDFAYYRNPNADYGYVSSNREGGKGLDDIYKFNLKAQTGIAATLLNKISSDPLINATVALYNENFELIEKTLSDEKGIFRFKKLNLTDIYILRVEKDKYFTEELVYNFEQGLPSEIFLEPKDLIIEQGEDVGKKLQINDIYFDLDQYNITKEAEEKLGLLLVVMEQFPDIYIDIQSHTDSRAGDEYNMQLSERRAQATKSWLVVNGVSSDRLRAKGFGETRLLNRCSNGVNCSESEHKVNRRSEFIVR